MIEDIFAHNLVWSENKRKADPDYFGRLATLQKPDFLWVGCSDSRVPANVITGLEPGEVFVHRNVANLVHRSDLNLMSVLEFAVEALEIKHIIVCGHYGCGGVHAAMEERRHGIVDHWLQPIRDIADDCHKDLESCDSDEAHHNTLCELSVKEQVSNLARTPIIQAAWGKGKQITIHGWIYSLNDGLLHDLDCSLSTPNTKG